jgi:class 3 adenylate cyclase
MVDKLNAEVSVLFFSDIVASTKLIQKLGEIGAHEAFEAHRADLKRVLTLTSGRELQWLGDGAMAVFRSAGEAVRCAVLLQKLAGRTRQPAIRIRIGIHAGDTLRDPHSDQLFGMPVVIARRLCDLAIEGQILCSRAIEMMVLGRSDLRFEAQGVARLKGVDLEVPICQVLWRSDAMTAAHNSRQQLFLPADDRATRRTPKAVQTVSNI